LEINRATFCGHREKRQERIGSHCWKKICLLSSYSLSIAKFA
jgi:hypothetical protein